MNVRNIFMHDDCLINPIGLLDGCIWEETDLWPGRVRLVETRDERQFKSIQEIPGVYYYKGNKRKKITAGWYLPQNLIDMGNFPGLLQGYSGDDISGLTPTLECTLRPHQRQAVAFIRNVTAQREGCILGADMGLGKTVATLQSLHLDNLLDQPGVICGPLPAAAAWCGPNTDATKHFGIEVKLLRGKKEPKLEQLANLQYCFINYDILPAWYIWVCANLKPAWVIFDECHLLMSHTAQRSEAAYKLSHWHSIERRIGLTGTPIPKNRLDLWNQLRIVQPRQWDESKHRFGLRYCGARKEFASGCEDEEREFWIYDGESNDTELRARLAGVLLRYTRYEVQGALPELTRNAHRLQFTARQLEDYIAASHDIVGYLSNKGELRVGTSTVTWGNKKIKLKASETAPKGLRLRAISTLIGLLSDLKAVAAAQLAVSKLEIHKHIVIFAWRRAAAKLIADTLRANAAFGRKGPLILGPIDGSMKQKERQFQAMEFARYPYSIYVATLGAAGIAINELAAGSCVIFSDLHWNTSVLTQAESRLHRDGSPHRQIEANYLVVDGTIDDLLIQHLSMKADAAAAINPNDQVGVNLVGDLNCNSGTTTDDSLDTICELLSQMEGDE